VPGWSAGPTWSRLARLPPHRGLPVEIDLALDVNLVGEESLGQKAGPAVLPLAGVFEAEADRRAVESEAGDVA
jgi:hypothetical protein